MSTLKRDLAFAYAAAAARVAAWAVVSAVVYRGAGPSFFALLAVARSSLGLLSYATIGLAPAMVRMLAQAGQIRAASPPDTHSPGDGTPVLDYATARPTEVPVTDGQTVVYANGLLLVTLLSLAAAVLLGFIVDSLPLALPNLAPVRFSAVRDGLILLGVGFIARLWSDAPSAMLQVRGKFALDSALVMIAEGAWAAACVWMPGGYQWVLLESVCRAFAGSGLLLLLLRLAAEWATSNRGFTFRPGFVRLATMAQLLLSGGTVVLAQLADWLYAPLALIVIARYLSRADVEAYAAAVQIDSALLLLVSGVAAVLLPRTALSFAAGDRLTVWRRYCRATGWMWLLLLVSALGVWAGSGPLLRAWLGADLPAMRLILPLVLVHTVIGGVGSLARAVMLGMGRERAFTVASLVAGVMNAGLAWFFVAGLGWGLAGVPVATVLVVSARYIVWQPAYLRRALVAESGVISPVGKV